MSDERELQAQLKQAQAELAERRATLPAHTVRVHQMAQLEELEDRVRELEARLEAAGSGDPA